MGYAPKILDNWSTSIIDRPHPRFLTQRAPFFHTGVPPKRGYSMQTDSQDKLARLIEKGVEVPAPQSVVLGTEVDPDRISGKGVMIYPGCKIFGQKTLIMDGVRLGHEGPVTVDDCQLGPNVDLKGGYFRKSVFLDGVSMGSGAQVREGSVLEEQVSGAHGVGLKQTILFPFVTLGSLINFCDCLMAGGTSRQNHSEVGSSYIHFNYTPNQDKATPSLIGDVPRGVMLNQSPIFLGGQGGLVGPVRIEFGTVIAAGVVCRKDACQKGKLLLGHGPVDRDINFHPGVYWHLKRIVFNNANYIANLIALRHWYEKVRSQFLEGHFLSRMLYNGLLERLDTAIEERINRFRALSEKMPESAEKYRSIMKDRASKRLLKQKEALGERWEALETVLRNNLGEPGDGSLFAPFQEEISRCIQEKGPDYVSVIQGLDRTWSDRGTRWLEGIVERINRGVRETIPSYDI